MRRTVFLVMLLLALAHKASAQQGPALAAFVEERTVGVRLTNGGAKPLPLYLGWSCSGPSPFAALFDDKEQNFVTAEKSCTVNTPLSKTLAPGSSMVVWSNTIVLARGAHRLQVRYRPGRDPMFDAKAKHWLGEAASPILVVPATVAERPSTRARLALAAWVEAGELAVRFHNDGPVPIHLYLGRGCGDRRGATPGRGVFTKEIDGIPTAVSPAECATPAPLVETIVPGERLIKWLGKINVSDRLHRIVVRYEVHADELGSEHRDAWSGELASAPVEVGGKR